MADTSPTVEQPPPQGDTQGTMMVPQGENVEGQTDSPLTQKVVSVDANNTAQETNGEPVDTTVSGQGPELPSKQSSELEPSSRGRQRRKNPKYSDYDTNEETDDKRSPSKRPRNARAKKSPNEGATRKTPAKRGRTKKAQELNQDAIGGTPSESVEETSQTTPKGTPAAKKTPVRKTPAEKTPARNTPATGEDLPDMEVGSADAEQQQKETPKPKRKYVKKQKVQEPAVQEEQAETPEVPEEEFTPSGRPRRGAAKAALKYLHSLAKEVFGHSNNDSGSQSGEDSRSHSPDPEARSRQDGPKGGRRGKKRRLPDAESDNVDDEDFVPNSKDEEEEEEEEEEESEEKDGYDSDFYESDQEPQGHARPIGVSSNGLPNKMMMPVWESTRNNKSFRDEHCSSWVFPEWIPTEKDWNILSHSESEKYLPQELQSIAFKVSREGLRNEETPLQRLTRFEAVPPHQKRWDMFFFAGGPVWAMEWCPVPDGASAKQYLALACHRGMDDQHFVNQLYTEPGLLQLWDAGELEYGNRPECCPVLAYGLALDKGFVWIMKWCPAGAWELPTTSRKAPLLPRLGLLAVATSNGIITIYSLPHPDALQARRKLPDSGETSQGPLICQAQGVLTLKLGSFKAPHHEKSGQVLSMDWLPDKPHNILAVGFHEGVVGLWDLCNKSALLRLRSPDRSVTLLPYHCFTAHDQSVRALAFCPASRHLLVSGGDDRMVKMWDLKRTYEPINSQKRHLSTEVFWPLHAPGVVLSQENAYAALGVHGVHYFEVGYQHMRPIFVVPRSGTMWSMSFSDWLNGLLTSDTEGEVIFALLPKITRNPFYTKRIIERRFPIYFTDMVPYDPNTTEEGQKMGGLVDGCGGDEERGGEDSRGGGGTEGEGAGGEEGGEKEKERETTVGEGGGEMDGAVGGGGEENGRPTVNGVSEKPQTYREAVKKYYLHYTDNDVCCFKHYQKRSPWKRMQATEVKVDLDMDTLPLAAVHKIRFNPNLSCHPWLASGGQAGLVRVHCLRGMNGSSTQKMVKESQAQFNAMFSPEDETEGAVDVSAVQTTTQQL